MCVRSRMLLFVSLLVLCKSDLVVAQSATSPVAEIRNVKAGAHGLAVEVLLARVGYIGAFVDKQNKGTGNWLTVVDTITLPLPAELNGTTDNVDGNILFPLVMPGKDESYRLTLFVKERRDDAASAFVYSTPLTFAGYDAPTAKPISNSINLEFSQDSLTISAKTDDKMILKAAWQVSGTDASFGLQATQNMQNPKVQLSYGALPKNASGGFPAMDIGLFDQSGAPLQEAKIAVSVVADKSVTDKVNSVKDQSSTSSKSNSTKFSWSDLAKTGLGAVMKYFTMGL
jgi:hypothetical protein